MEKQVRSIPVKFETREEEDNPVIEAYFTVYNSNYDIAPGMSESIAPGAFSRSLSGDIRALINHDTTLVLGRTSAHTLDLRDDSHGLFGVVKINRNDSDAMNVYARVKRGDVSQCSIGFNIIGEDTDIRDDGSVHWTIRDAELVECSICTFPAYTETSATARSKQRDELIKRETAAWKIKMKARLRNDGTESTDAETRN
jgi:HK97 family phage prohead protease